MIVINGNSVIPFSPGGYAYTVSLGDGVGSLLLPATRGTVYEDVPASDRTHRAPYFRMVTGGSNFGELVTTDRGYNRVYCYQGTIHSQVSGYTNYLGLENMIRTYEYGASIGDKSMFVWMFPTKYNDSNYGFVINGYGDLEYPYAVGQVNDVAGRYIGLRGPISSLEIHVNVVGTYPFLGNLIGVFIPIYHNNQYRYFNMALVKRLEGGSNYFANAYYTCSLSSSVVGNTTLIYCPVFLIANLSSNWYQCNYNVQTKFALVYNP